MRIDHIKEKSGISSPRSVAGWKTARGIIPLDRPLVAGILNVTPDSFSDGGRYLDPAAALAHAGALLAQGADLLDIGAESTRPGRPQPVPEEEEWRRLAPVLEAVVGEFPDTPISVDTVKSGTARRALGAGAHIINDVSGLRADGQLAAVCAGSGAGLILMHSRGSVTDMATYEHAIYHDVVAEVSAELSQAVAAARRGGVAPECLVLDPGLGFSKEPAHNYTVLNRLEKIVALGFPVMVGPSRKRFLTLATDRPVADRDPATAAACVAAYCRGAMLFRVHNAGLAREALAVAHAIGMG